jgi:hypothetical protein
VSKDDETGQSFATSEDICEALVRHTEMIGSEVFEKFFVKNGRIKCVVYCVIGENAEPFRESVHEWLKDNGLSED